MVKQMSKKSRFREPFDKQNGSGNEHCSNLNHTPFTIFIDHCEGNWDGKGLSEGYAKS